MKHLLLACLFTAAAALPARADACDTLIGNAQGALANPSLAPVEKNFLEELLKAARGAKAAGDTQACQGALRNSQPFRDPSKGRDCAETPDTV
jgi:hypothetical protein